MDITLGMMKGGTAKSTSAVHLALGLHRATGQRVALIDADVRSQTTTDWTGLAGDAWPQGITVFPWHDAASMSRRVAGIRGDYPHIVRDTGGDQPDVLEACLVDTDLLIAPIAASGSEFRRVPATLAIAQQVAVARNPNLGILVLLVKVVRNDVDAKTIRAQLTEGGAVVLDTEVPVEKRYMRAFGGVPAELGAYDDLTAEVLASVGQEVSGG